MDKISAIKGFLQNRQEGIKLAI